MTNIITQIGTFAVREWNAVEADIEADFAKVKAALPASSQPNLAATVSDLKQSASDVLSLAGGAAAAFLPELLKGGETALDTAMVTYSNGVALPLVPIVNSGIETVGNSMIAMVQAWMLKQKASLAPAVTGASA